MLKLNLCSLGVGVALFCLAPQARAMIIDATIDPSITDPQMIADIQFVTDFYRQFRNPIEVFIDFKLGTRDPGYVAESLTSLYYANYSDYTGLLIQDSAAHPWNKDLATAVAHLGDGNRPATTGLPYIYAPSADWGALGVGVPGYIGADWGIGDGTFDGVVALSDTVNWATGWSVAPDQYSAITSLFHEVDEVLGLGGPSSGLGRFPDGIGPDDLFRYDWFTHQPSYTTDPNAIAYFSIDGGQTAREIFNNTGYGDYADWALQLYTGCADQYQHVQDAGGCFGHLHAMVPGAPELTALHAVGYNPVPEPRAWTMLIMGLAIAGAALRGPGGVAMGARHKAV
jgi:hypothetical protein